MRIVESIGRGNGRSASLALAGALAILSLLTAACRFSAGRPDPPAEPSVAAAPPEITGLTVFENVYTERRTDFPLGSSVAVCFTITPRESRRALTLVLSDRPEPPRAAAGAGVLGRSAPIPPKDGPGCYEVRVARRPEPAVEPREYRMWVLHGSEALAQASFHAVAAGAAPIAATRAAPGALASPQPAPVRSAPDADGRRDVPVQAPGAAPGPASSAPSAPPATRPPPMSGQGTAMGPTPSPQPTPRPSPRPPLAIAGLVICDARVDCGEDPARASWDEVTACFQVMGPAGDRRLVLVATGADAAPGGPEAASVVARSDAVRPTERFACHTLRATRGALGRGAYWLWILEDATPLERARFVLGR